MSLLPSQLFIGVDYGTGDWTSALIRFTILGEPASKANSRRNVVIGGMSRSIKSKKALDYEKYALVQIPIDARQRLSGPVCVTLRIFYASHRPDLDESLILDILQDRYIKTKVSKERVLVQAGVYQNDRQVREKHVYHAIDKRNPRCIVEVKTLEPELPL
jgi:Holliday junction resolvase RusA-like endonuclease